MRLRARLFVSYVVLLLSSLLVVSVVLIIFFGTQPAPPDLVWGRLAGIVQGINVRDLLDEFAPTQERIPEEFNRLTELMDGFATTRRVRVMWLTQIDDTTLVLYDSADIFPRQTDIIVNNERFFSDSLEQTLQRGAGQIYGSFVNPDNTQWLYAGVTRDMNIIRRREVRSVFLVAEPAPTVSLGAALAEFSGSILPAMAQATVVALLLALVMAALISRSLVQPLRNLLMGVRAVTHGNYEHRIPEMGPPEVRELAREFNLMSNEVRSTQHAQRDFLANVSHDLKTPLTSIQGYSQAIMDGAAKDPSQAARIIYDEAGRMNRLVNELTDLIRMQAGGMTLKMTSLDLNMVVSAIVERLMVVAQKKNIDLSTKLAPLPPISADGDRLAQVLTNLLSNAIKYTLVGGKIQVRTLPSEHGVELQVEDNGVGIPAEDLPRLFERFYQVDKARGPQRGTGLGLAITQEIVHAHGGDITIESGGQNKGTTVRVKLPLVRDGEKKK
jgi:signal transduction histidine kinase